MKTTITKTILTALALIAVGPNARAEIASKAYVDDGLSGKMNTMTIDSTPTDSSANLVSSGGVAAAIAAAVYDDTELTNRLDNVGGEDYGGHHTMEEILLQLSRNKVENHGYGNNAIMTTDNNGYVQSTTGSFLTNNHISQNAGIDIGKLNLPTPPAACDTQGCMLMRYDGKYVWELVMRDNNETVSTTGAVSATPTSISPQTKGSDGYGSANSSGEIVCDGWSNGLGPDGKTCVGQEI